MATPTRSLLALTICGILVALFAFTAPGRQIVGSLLTDAERFLSLQRKADFDQNRRIDFSDFTFFASKYGQEAG